MRVPCVRVEREAGEATRRRLAEGGHLDRTHEIDAEEGWLFIPIIDPEAVPSDLQVVEHDVEARETQTTPADLLGFEPSYERLGDVVILHEDDPDRAGEIADAIMASDLPSKTVVNRASPVAGERRVREWAVLAGDGTETVHREYGCSFRVDIAEVYFSPRLATERHRVIEQVEGRERMFDMFCGVGPFVIPAAKRGAETVGVDVNPIAIDYLRENAQLNGVVDRVTGIVADVRDVAPDYSGWADRIVMNLPHRADEFLDAALEIAGNECVVHYYDIQPEDDPFGTGEEAIRMAAEAAEYEATVGTRHVVRSYAPGVVNSVLDVRLTRSGEP